METSYRANIHNCKKIINSQKVMSAQLGLFIAILRLLPPRRLFKKKTTASFTYSLYKGSVSQKKPVIGSHTNTSSAQVAPLQPLKQLKNSNSDSSRNSKKKHKFKDGNKQKQNQRKLITMMAKRTVTSAATTTAHSLHHSHRVYLHPSTPPPITLYFLRIL